MAANSNAVATVTPTVSITEANDKMTEIKVTVIDGKETAVIAHNETLAYMHLAFSLQDDYENESAFTKDNMVKAAHSFLRAECARVISKWDNIITASSKLQRYKNVGRADVEKKLRDNPK